MTEFKMQRFLEVSRLVNTIKREKRELWMSGILGDPLAIAGSLLLFFIFSLILGIIITVILLITGVSFVKSLIVLVTSILIGVSPSCAFWLITRFFSQEKIEEFVDKITSVVYYFHLKKKSAGLRERLCKLAELGIIEEMKEDKLSYWHDIARDAEMIIRK